MRLSRVGHGVELPNEFSGNHIEGPEVSGRRNIFFARRRTKDHQILKDLSGASGLYPAHGGDIALQSLAKIHDAILAKTRDREPGGGVDFLQIAVDRENQPPVFAVLAFPIVDAAAVYAAQAGVDPDLLSRCGIQRNYRTIASQPIHHVVDDDRVESCFSGWINPGNFHLADVGLGDLFALDVMRTVRPSTVVRPRYVLAVRKRQRYRGAESRSQHPFGDAFPG